MAENPAEAYQNEKHYKPEDVWLDEKQPEEKPGQIGYDLPPSDDYYGTAYLKKKTKKKRK